MVTAGFPISAIFLTFISADILPNLGVSDFIFWGVVGHHYINFFLASRKSPKNGKLALMSRYYFRMYPISPGQKSGFLSCRQKGPYRAKGLIFQWIKTCLLSVLPEKRCF